jgi:hypothetical protein
LCKGPYLEAMRRFQRCRLYANVYNDMLVPYCTASIQPYNPYRRGDSSLATSPLYPHITLQSLHVLAAGDGQRPRPTVEPSLFAHTARELPAPGCNPPFLTRALTPLSAGITYYLLFLNIQYFIEKVAGMSAGDML